MAKKSAASKGYRKTVKKKPFLTKKEIIALVAIVVAIIVGVVLFNLFYEDGYLRVSDIQENDVVTVVSRQVNNRYLKVADANELEGFTRSNEYRDVNPASSFTYTPDEPTDDISSITLGGSFLNAAELADSSIASLQSFNASGSFAATERADATVQGHDASIVSYTLDYYQAPEGEEAADSEETPESNVFSQSISLYVAAGEGRTVCLHISRTGEDDSFYLADDEVADFILGYADQVFTVYDESEQAA